MSTVSFAVSFIPQMRIEHKELHPQPATFDYLCFIEYKCRYYVYDMIYLLKVVKLIISGELLSIGRDTLRVAKY
jgi:hypothetical protein